MTRRSGRGADYDGGAPPADVEAEAAATSTAIAGLRRRLKRLGSLEHPSVRRELRKLAEEVAVLEVGKRRPGRHRSNVSRLPVRPIERTEPTEPAAQADANDDPPDADLEPQPSSSSKLATASA